MLLMLFILLTVYLYTINTVDAITITKTKKGETNTDSVCTFDTMNC